MKRPATTSRTPSATIPPARDVIAALLIAFAVLTFFYLIHVVLLPFVLAGAVAYIFTPLVDWLTIRTRAPRIAWAMAVFVALVAITVGGGYLVLPGLLQQLMAVLTNLQGMLEAVLQRFMGTGTVQLLGQPTSASQLAAEATGSLRNMLQQAGSMGTLLIWTFGSIRGFFLTWTLLAYFLIGGRNIARGFLSMFPPKWRSRVGRVMLRLHPILLRYFVGIAVVVIYACLAAYIGLGLILGLHHAVFLALLTGFLEVVPVIGPATSAVVAGLVAIQEAKSLWSILAYVIYATALRLSIDQLVGPLVLGRAARVNPSLVIFCFLTGGVLFGIAGIILAVPIALTVKVMLATIYREPLVGTPKKVTPRRK
jgi:predicted PurR-regulated permease PerM